MKRHIRIPHESGNMTPKLQAILKQLPSNEETVLEFEQGTYLFARNGSEKHRIFASSSVSGENSVIFPLIELNNLTVDGNGSDFVFCDRIQPFLLQRCRNVTLKNFTMDYSFLRYAFGKVRSIDSCGFAVELDPTSFDYRIADGFLSFICGSDVLSTETRKISIKRISPTKSRTYFLYAGNSKAVKNYAARHILADAEAAEGCVFLRYREGSVQPEFSAGDIICLAYDNDREAQAFYADSCQDLRVENVSVYRNGGMGFVADTCENIDIDGLRIALKPGRKEYFSSTADGIYITNCSGTFTLRNALIQDTYDDAINIHGFYTKIAQVLSENRVRLDFLHPAHSGLIPCQAGDILSVSDPESRNELGHITVRDVSVNADRDNILIEYVGIPLQEGMLLENRSRMPAVTIENNTVINCPHMRLSAPHMTLRNNVLDLNTVGIYIYDLLDFWGESGAAEQVLIESNQFGSGGGHSIEIGSCRPATANRLHSAVTIRNNRFAKPREEALQISSVRKLTVEDNQFEVFPF